MHKKVEQQVDVLPPLSNQPKKKKSLLHFSQVLLISKAFVSLVLMTDIYTLTSETCGQSGKVKTQQRTDFDATNPRYCHTTGIRLS